MIGSPGNDESASSKETRPSRLNDSHSISPNTAITISTINNDYRFEEEEGGSKQSESCLLEPPSPSAPTAGSTPSPPAPSTIQATSSQHEQSIKSLSPPPASGTRSRSMSLVPGLDMLSPILFSGIIGGHSGPGSTVGETSKPSGPSRERKNSCLTERTPQFMTVAPSFTTRTSGTNGPWSHDRIARARQSIDVRSFPSYLARKRQSIIGARLFDTLVEVAGSPLQAITPEGDENEDNRSSTDNNSGKNNDSRGSRKSLIHRLRGNRKSISDEEPEAPTLSLGERVAWLKSKGPEFGTVRWIGRLPKVSASWTVGVEFDNAIGCTDGKFEGRRYFTAKDTFAKFLPLSSLTRVDNIIGRHRSGTLLSRMSVQLKPGQLISVQRESENNLPIHCALNAPHHIDHDVHVPNMNHCLCNNCNHPCAHLCKTKKPKGRKTDMAHMCHFSQKPHNKLCCGGEELLYSLASAQDLEMAMNGSPQVGDCPSHGRRRLNSNLSSNTTNNGESTSGAPNGSHRRRSGRSDASRRRSSGSSSTIRRLRDKSRRISSAPTSTERKAESQTKSEGEVGGGNGNGHQAGDNEQEEGEREEEGQVIIGLGKGADCEEGLMSLDSRSNFALCKLKSASELSISSLPSTVASQVEVYIARGALTDESDLDDDDEYGDEEDEEEDNADDDGCSSGLVSSQGRRYLKGSTHGKRSTRNQRRRRRRQLRVGASGNCSRSMTTLTGRSSRSSRRRNSSDGGGTGIGHGGDDDCSRTRRSGKRSGLRSLVSCLVPSIPNSYKKNDKSSKKGKKTKNGQNNRRSKNADNPSKRTLDNNSINCDSPFYHYSHYPCSCDGQSTFTGPIIDPMGPMDSNGHPLVYSLQDQHYLYSSHHHYHHPLHASHNHQQHSNDHRHHYHQQQQHSSSYHHHHHAHRHQQQQNSSKQLAHFNSTNNRQQNHSSSSTHHQHQHHHHQQQQQQQQQQQHNCAPQATTCSSSLSRRSRQRKYHGLSTSPEPSPSVSVKNRSSLQHSNLHQHHHYPVEDNLTFGVGVGLAGRASPCGHFYYSPCSVSASQLSIGALQKHLSTTTISKSQATKGKENSQSKHRQPNSPPKDQVDSNTNQEQGSKGLQRLVDLDDNLCELTHKTVDNIEILSDLNAKSNCLLTSSPPCSTEKTNLIESALNNTNKDCLINLDSNHSNNLVNNKSANSKSIENNYTNHNNSNNNKYNRINNEVNISSKSSNHHSCNGINHAFSPRLYESNSIGSPGFDGRLIGTANNINYQYQQQQYRHEPTCSPSSSTTKTTANGINGENVLTNENNCSYNDNTNYDNDNNSNYDDDNYDYRKNRDEKNEITNDNEMDCNESSMSEQNNHNVNHDSSNSNSNRKLNNFKIEVELTCSPSVQSYTSSSMISPRRKRKGPAPPPPVNLVTTYTSFPSIPGPSGVNVSPFTSPSSSGSSPSASQPATPLHSTSQGEPSTPSTSSSLLSPSSYPILAPSNSQSSSISSGPSTSTWQSHSTTQSMGRKKSIKTKPAPSPPPPLPPLPPIASASEMQRSSPTKPTVKTPTATNKNNDNGASSFVQKSSPRTPLSVNMIPTNCTSNRPSTCQPVIKCLPCRSHSVPVCPMVTLTRSLSDQKQINVKNMLKSVASYSSDLALPQSTVGLIASSRAIQQTLESDSIIITYDEPDYLYPIHHGLTNCYSSCEIPYNISCNTNSPNYIGTNNGSNNLLMVCKEDAKVANNINCKMNDKGLRMRQKSQSFESTSLPTSPIHQKSITDRPPRPPRPSSIVNYKMINRSHPVIPMRTKRRSLLGSTCCTHGCRPDTLTLKERSGSFPLRPRSLPASPISKPYQGSSSTLPSPKSTSSAQSNLTFTRDKTLSGSFSGSTNQGNTGSINPSHTMCSIGCLTSCSLCSLSGLDGTTLTSTSNPTDQSTHLNYPSKDVHVNHDDDDEDNCSNIYEEIDFTSISENVAALVSPRQLINPNAVNNNVSRNHPKDESEKDKIANDLVNCDENNNGNNNVDNGNDMVITCNKEPNVVSIDSTRRLSSSSGPQANNSGGEILSDTSDDRVTVKSVNIKPWAYSTSSLDSEQSTTSSGSTVKQWNNQIIYSSHHHPCHPHHEQHHESQSPNYPHHHHHYDHNHSHHSDALSSPCFHGNYSDFYQGIDHPHPFHHPHSHHHHQAHHLYPYQMTNNHLLHASLDHCHHCPYHHHHHHHHAPRQMITTSTSDHSLSSLSSNFSEDPATPTPPMMTLDDYTFHSSNFTFTPEDHYLVSPCCPEHLDEQDEDDVINDKKGSLKHSDDKEEEVNVAFKNEVKNGFGLIPCYPQPFYPIPDLVCDKETNEDENDDDDDDEEDNDDSVGKRFNKMTLKEDKGEQVKEDDEKGKEKKLLVNFKSSSVSSLKNSVKSSWPVKGKDAIPSLSSSPTSSSPSSAHQPAIFSPFVKPFKDNQLNNSVHNSNINCYCHQCFLPHCAKSTFNSTHHNLNHQRKDTFKESPSKMASSWDGSLSGAGGCSSGAGSGAGDDSNESSTHQYQSPNGSASINRLMQELQLAISFGQHRKAALLARQLALRKVSCTFNQSPNSTAIDDQPIIVYLYIEDKQSRQGPFPVQLYPSMTVKMLKLKIEGDFGFPVHFQSWILGKCLATNEDNCLSTYGITSSGCPIFLYLLSNSRKSETLSETAQHDDDEDDDDDGEKVDKNGNADEDEEEQDGVDNGLKEIKGATEMVQQSIPIVGTLTGQNDDEKGKNELAGSLTSKSVNAAIKGPSNGPSDSTFLSSEPSTVNEKDIISVRKRSKVKVKPSLLLLSNSIATSTSTLTSPSTSTVQSTTMKPTTKIIKSTAHGENRDYRGNTGSRQMNNSTLPVGSLKKHHPKANLKADNGAMISTFDKQSVDSSKLKVKVDSRKASNINDKANQGNDEVDSGIDKDNDVNKESNDNQMVAQEKDESKGQIITTTYKELMALDDVDLVKNFEDFECPVCFINIPSGEGVVLRDCLHMFCRDCLSNAIEFCDEAIVKCPYRSDEYYCDSEITDREIKSLASPELYQKYLSRSMKAAELRIAKSFHCKTIDCPGWCEFDDNVNTFPCPVCGKVNCLTCQAIHEGINCRQYQDQLDDEAADQNEDAQKTKQFLDNMLDKGEALRCPICFVILIKKWGCDWVKCSMCQSEICWVTKGPRWGPGGKGDVSGGCKCMLNGQKCHPKCNYCH